MSLSCPRLRPIINNDKINPLDVGEKQLCQILCVISFNDLYLNVVSYELYKDKEKLKLSKKEFELIKYLIVNPNIVVSKDNILDKIWGFDSELASNSIEVYISFLRKKVEYLNVNAKLITIRGVGYKLVSKDV